MKAVKASIYVVEARLRLQGNSGSHGSSANFPELPWISWKLLQDFVKGVKASTSFDGSRGTLENYKFHYSNGIFYYFHVGLQRSSGSSHVNPWK